jgi:hypothetical protein
MKIRFDRFIVLLFGLTVGCTTENGATPNEANSPPTNLKENAMTDTQTKQIWNAYVQYDDQDEKFAGQLAIEKGMLSVVSAESDKARQYLQQAVENMNALEQLMDLTPPKSLDAPQFSVSADIYERDHPDFEKVLVRKLLDEYDLRVVPEK